MATVEITHTPEDGTLLTGSRRGDGVWEVLRPLGWKPFSTIGCLGIPGMRDRVAPRARITTAKTALEAAGHTVTVNIDDTVRDRGTVLAAQADRLDDRADRLNDRAGQHAANADAAYRRSDQISGAFEGGQPILVGHSSERRARRDRDRMHDAMARSVAEDKAAHHIGQQAAVVGRQAERSIRPDVTARRLVKLRKELADLDRITAGREPVTDAQHEWVARAAQLRDQIGYDQQQLDAAIAAGEWVLHTPKTVHIGDKVKCTGLGWGLIVKVNRTTVAVETPHTTPGWPLKQTFLDILQVKCVHAEVAGVGAT